MGEAVDSACLILNFATCHRNWSSALAGNCIAVSRWMWARVVNFVQELPLTLHSGKNYFSWPAVLDSSAGGRGVSCQRGGWPSIWQLGGGAARPRDGPFGNPGHVQLLVHPDMPVICIWRGPECANER